MRGCVSQWASMIPGIMEPGMDLRQWGQGPWHGLPSPQWLYPQKWSESQGRLSRNVNFLEDRQCSCTAMSQSLLALFWLLRLKDWVTSWGKSGRMIQIRICLTERVLWVHFARWRALHLCTHSRVPMALTSKSWWQTKQTLSSLSSFPRLLQNDSEVIKVQLIYKSKEKRRRTISLLQISAKF